MMRDAAVSKWFDAHDAYHKASAAYNARLAMVRLERDERNNWSMNCDPEYKALNDAQHAALAADHDLYTTLAALK